MKRTIQSGLLMLALLQAFELYPNPIIAATKLTGSFVKQSFNAGKWFFQKPLRSFFTGVSTTMGTGYGLLTEEKRTLVKNDFQESANIRKSALTTWLNNVNKQYNNIASIIKING